MNKVNPFSTLATLFSVLFYSNVSTEDQVALIASLEKHL